MKIHNFDEKVDMLAAKSKRYEILERDPEILPMWIADTDFKVPQEIIDAMVERTLQGTFGYPSEVSEYSEAVQHWMATRFDTEVDADEVVFVPGVLPGIVYLIRAMTNPGDKILINGPAYLQLQEITRNNGRRVELCPLLYMNSHYELDFERMEKQLRDERVTMMLLCNPHNPTGRVFTRDELERIGRMCLENDVFLVSDEIHCDMVYPGYKHTPIISLDPEIARNAATFINPSKSFNIPGLRSGAAIIPDANVRKKMNVSIVNNKAYGRNCLGQIAVITAYTQCAYYIDQEVAYVQENLKLLTEFLEKNVPEIKVVKPEAMYLIWLDCRSLGLDQDGIDKFFLDECKIKLNNGGGFGPDGIGFMRMNIACTRAQVEEACRRMDTAAKALRAKRATEEA